MCASAAWQGTIKWKCHHKYTVYEVLSLFDQKWNGKWSWYLICREIYCTYIQWLQVFESQSKIQSPLYNQQMQSIKWEFLGKKRILYNLNMGRFQSQVTVRSMSSLSVMQIGFRLHENLLLINLRSYTWTKLYTIQISMQ